MKNYIYILITLYFIVYSCNRPNDNIIIKHFDNGKIKSKECIINGKREGKCVYYFEDGNISGIINFHNNIKHGYFIYYYGNGNIEKKGYYSKGVLSGIVVHFGENNDTLYKRVFNKGVLDKDYGFLNNKIIYKADYLNNKYIAYDTNRQVVKVCNIY